MKIKLYLSATVVIAALILTAFYASGLCIAAPAGRSGLGSGAGAAAIVVLNAMLLYFTHIQLSSRTNFFIPAIYIALTAANPNALHWTGFHAASLFLLASVILHMAYCVIRPSKEHLAGAFATLSIAALLAPQLFWLFPLYLLSGIGKSDEKGKYLAISVLAMALPLLAYIGIMYIRYGFDGIHGVFPALWSEMSGIRIQNFHFHAATILRILMEAIAGACAFTFIVRNFNKYKTIQFFAYMRTMMFMLALSLIALLFKGDGAIPYELFTAIPVTLLLGEYSASSNDGKGKTALLSAMGLVLIAERISLLEAVLK